MTKKSLEFRVYPPKADPPSAEKNGGRLVSIVIPVFNEAESLEELCQRISRTLQKLEPRLGGASYEIIFIDDGSSDGSYEVLKKLKENDCQVNLSRIKIIKFRRNFGQTAAIQAGFDYAKGDIIITMDADLQNAPEDIPELLKKMEEGYDIISGWRYPRKEPLFSRRLPSNIANWLISKTTGVRLHDYGCSLKAYKKEITEGIKLYGEMHRFIPALGSWMGAKIGEIKVSHYQRTHGKSKYGMARTGRVILDLITVKFLLTFSTSPIQLFGKLTFISFLLGFLSGVGTILMKIFMAIDMTGNPLLYLTILFGVIGGQFITLGLLGEIIVRSYYEAKGKSIYAIKEILE